MTGRRRIDAVTAGFLTRAVTAAIVLSALGNLILIGCFVGWLDMLSSGSPFHSGLWLVTGAAVCHFLAGATVMFAWAWSR